MTIEYGPTTVTYNGEYLGMTMASDHERLRAYNQGYDAWDSDISDKDSLCPYPVSHPKSGLRTAWYNGLLDNRFSKYDHIPNPDDYQPKVPPKCRR